MLKKLTIKRKIRSFSSQSVKFSVIMTENVLTKPIRASEKISPSILRNPVEMIFITAAKFQFH